MHQIFKLHFDTGVHFGDNSLEVSTINFCADTLFSALYIEALKIGKIGTEIADKFYSLTKNGELLFSDAFPFKASRYYLPKPMLIISSGNLGKSGDFVEKKKYKNLQYIAVDMLNDYLAGKFDFEKNDFKDIGVHTAQTKAFVRNDYEEAKPYRVGVYNFTENCGLYVLLSYKSEEGRKVFEQLLDNLSYTGIGGKRSAGMGRFHFEKADVGDDFEKLLTLNSQKKMLLCTALPQGKEMISAVGENANDSSYMLQKRSGYVFSETYSQNFVKKNDLYVFKAGSVFKNTFVGDIYNVSGDENSKHSVYRYAKGLFIGLEGI